MLGDRPAEEARGLEPNVVHQVFCCKRRGRCRVWLGAPHELRTSCPPLGGEGTGTSPVLLSSVRFHSPFFLRSPPVGCAGAHLTNSDFVPAPFGGEGTGTSPDSTALVCSLHSPFFLRSPPVGCAGAHSRTPGLRARPLRGRGDGHFARYCPRLFVALPLFLLAQPTGGLPLAPKAPVCHGGRACRSCPRSKSHDVSCRRTPAWEGQKIPPRMGRSE